MPRHLRISRVFIALGVFLTHFSLFLALSRHRPVVQKSDDSAAIPIAVVLSSPKQETALPPRLSEERQQVDVMKPRVEKTPTQKQAVQKRDMADSEDGYSGPAIAKESSPKEKYGAFLVRRTSVQPSALGVFYNGFNCARLIPEPGRYHCPPNPVNLIVGQEAQIAFVAARMGVSHDRQNVPRRFLGIKRPPPGSTQTISTITPTGSPIIGENFATIPPEYPDPAFGD